MSILQKSKVRFDLIDTSKFKDTSRYHDDIFTIYNPEFAKHVPNIYQTEFQLNKANTSDKETSFLDLREKGRDLTQSYDNSPYTDRKSKSQRDNTKTPPKPSITQRMRTDLGRSVGWTIAIQLVWLNRFTGSQPSH